MTIFDFVCGVAFGAIGGNMIFNHTLPLWIGVIGLSLFSLLTLCSDYISLKSKIGRKIMESKPQVIVENGKIHLQTMKQTRLTVDDLLMLLRKNSCFHLNEIETAIFETDGSISVLKKSANSSFPVAGIIDGHIMDDNLKLIGKEGAWVQRQLKARNVELKQVLLAQIDREEHVHLFLK
nr:YetF domain-containing protein [Paenibacillus sp. yr247]